MKKIPDSLIQQLEAIKSNLYATSLIYMKNEDDAIEVVSQTVFIILKKHKQLRQPEYFKTWATRILINECKKELKKKQKIEVKDDIEISVEDIHNLPLKEALLQLPSDLRVLIEFKYFQGYTLKEISYILDKPITTLSSQIQKALRLLKIELEVKDE